MNSALTEQVISATKQWLRSVVIELGLCPFAKREFDGGFLSYRVSWADSATDAHHDFLAFLDAFIGANPDRESTSLLIFPRALTNFDEFNDHLDLVEESLVAAGAEGLVQVASFHPHYRFADSPVDDPANFTNRSPFPMLHLLREAQLEARLADYPDPESIPARNIHLLRELGLTEMVRRLAACQTE